MEFYGKILFAILFLGFGVGTAVFLLDTGSEEPAAASAHPVSVYLTPEATVLREWNDLRSLTGPKLREKMRGDVGINIQNSYAEKFLDDLARTIREERKTAEMKILGSKKYSNGRDAEVYIRLTWRNEPPENITVQLRLNENTGVWRFGKFCFWDKLEQHSQQTQAIIKNTIEPESPPLQKGSK